jgi:hypothetical protein
MLKMSYFRRKEAPHRLYQLMSLLLLLRYLVDDLPLPLCQKNHGLLFLLRCLQVLDPNRTMNCLFLLRT